MNSILTGISLIPSREFVDVISEATESGLIGGLSWSPELGWSETGVDRQVSELLLAFSKRKALFGHGVYYSPFTVSAGDHHQKWLNRFKRDLDVLPIQHFSEHFGFIVTGSARRGAPLPLPLCSATERIGIKRLRTLKRVANLPIGLENLALSFSSEDALNQGPFVTRVLRAVDGFLLLDLHNLFCASLNFSIPWKDLLATWPMSLVREIHVSGGSWSSHSGHSVRRDTHAAGVPEVVWDMLKEVLPQCPNIRIATLEIAQEHKSRTRLRSEMLHDLRVLNNIVRSASVDKIDSRRPQFLSRTPSEDFRDQLRSRPG